MTLMSTPRRLCLGGRGAAPLRDLLLSRGVDGPAGWGRGRGPPAAVSGRRANVMCEGAGAVAVCAGPIYSTLSSRTPPGRALARACMQCPRPRRGAARAGAAHALYLGRSVEFHTASAGTQKYQNLNLRKPKFTEMWFKVLSPAASG